MRTAFILLIAGALIWLGIIFWAYNIGLQHGKDYMVQNWSIPAE